MTHKNTAHLIVPIEGTECDRLRAVNAELLAALQAMEQWARDLSEQSDSNACEYLASLRRGYCQAYEQALAALANATKGQS